MEIKKSDIESIDLFSFSANEIEFAPGLPYRKEHKTSTVNFYFRRFPDWMVFEGVLTMLSANAVKVFLVLLAHTNNSSYAGKLSNQQLSRFTGISRKRLYVYISELEELNILESITCGHVRRFFLLLQPKTYKQLTQHKQPSKGITRELCIKRE